MTTGAGRLEYAAGDMLLGALIDAGVPFEAVQQALDCGQIDEIIGELPAYLQGIVREANLINAAVRQQYIAHPVDSGLA